MTGDPGIDEDVTGEDVTAEEASLERLARRERQLVFELAGRATGLRTEAIDTANLILDWTSVEDPADEKQVTRALNALRREHTYMFTYLGVDAGSRSEHLDSGVRLAQGATPKDHIRAVHDEAERRGVPAHEV